MVRGVGVGDRSGREVDDVPTPGYSLRESLGSKHFHILLCVICFQFASTNYTPVLEKE